MSILSKHTPTRHIYSDRHMARKSRGFRVSAGDFLTSFGVTFGDVQIAYVGEYPVAVVKNHKLPGGGYRLEGYRTERQYPGDPMNRNLERQMNSINALTVSQERLDEIILEFIAAEITDEINRRLTGE